MHGEMGVAPCPSWEPWKGQDGHPVQKPSHTLLHVHIFVRIFTNHCLPAGPISLYSCPLSLFVCILDLSGRQRENSSACSFVSQYPTTAPLPFYRGTGPGPIAHRGSWELSCASCREGVWEHKRSYSHPR